MKPLLLSLLVIAALTAAPEKFAGHRVTVTGTVDAKAMSIKVDSIVPAK